MKRKLFVLSLAFVLCFSVSGVNAGSVWLTPTSQTVVLGQPVTLDINLDFSEWDILTLSEDWINSVPPNPPYEVTYMAQDGISGGSFDITFDPTKLAFASFAFDPTWPINSGEILSFGPADIGSGQLDSLNFGTFNFAPLLETSPIPLTGVIGTLTFSTIDLATDSLVSLLPDSSFGIDNGGFISFVDGDPAIELYEGATVNINAVPIPGALLLLGSGLIGLVGLRRKLS